MDRKARQTADGNMSDWMLLLSLVRHTARCLRGAVCTVLCHVSLSKWCKASGAEVGSPEMKERCRRLTADVASKTVELLNANLQSCCQFAGSTAEVKSCLSCHGKELHDTLGQMRCGSCHQQLSKKHHALSSAPVQSSDN
jgi:hypothetical protein